MTVKQLYLIDLLIIVIAGIIYTYQMITLNVSYSILREALIYILIAHALTLTSFLWMVLVKGMSTAFYKEGYAQFHVGTAMIVAYVIPIILLFMYPISDLIIDQGASLLFAVVGIPLGASIGYKVVPFESEQ